jgi:hypothetical protein
MKFLDIFIKTVTYPTDSKGLTVYMGQTGFTFCPYGPDLRAFP